VSSASTATERVTAVDFRAGVTVGKTFFDRLTLYLAGRVFAGPVFWQIDGVDVTGGDVHHYSLGGGAPRHAPGAARPLRRGDGRR
jgi:hypothetical protein